MNPHQNPFAGNTPQDVTERQGENAIFIVYGLNQSPDAVDKVKDVCANFSALIRSMRNRFPDAQFSSTISFSANVWDRIFPGKGKSDYAYYVSTLRNWHIHLLLCRQHQEIDLIRKR